MLSRAPCGTSSVGPLDVGKGGQMVEHGLLFAIGLKLAVDICRWLMLSYGLMSAHGLLLAYSWMLAQGLILAAWFDLVVVVP